MNNGEVLFDLQEIAEKQAHRFLDNRQADLVKDILGPTKFAELARAGFMIAPCSSVVICSESKQYSVSEWHVPYIERGYVESMQEQGKLDFLFKGIKPHVILNSVPPRGGMGMIGTHTWRYQLTILKPPNSF